MSKQLIRCLAAVLSATALGAAVAGPEVIEVSSGPLRGVYPAEADAIVGSYRMSDGRDMQLVRRGNSISARLDGEPVTRLLAVGSGQLRDVEGRMSMRFDTETTPGEPTVTVVLTPVNGQRLALASTPRR